jgi:hypothetical protein
VVPQSDLILHLEQIAPELLLVGLPALARDIECIPHMNPQRLVFGPMADRVLAGKLPSALRIGLIDPHRSGRQRHPEPRFLLVLAPDLLSCVHNERELTPLIVD